MNNYRKISFDIDFAGKKVLNTIQIALEELTQNDFNSSLLELKLMQGEELINLQGLSVVLNFLMPSGKDYVDTINAEMIDIENSIVSYFIPKDILSEVGTVVGTVSLYKEGYRYTSIVQFKFEVVSDFVEDREIVESDNYPILAQMIGEVQNFKDEEMKRIESEIERIENEGKRESSELQREIDEVERHEAENVRIINEQNREVKELERDQAERLREANSAKVKREEEVRIEAETLRVQSELSRVEAENNRIQSELTRQSKETDRQSKESERQEAENLRVSAETMREAKQNEFNARAEEVALRIEEQAQRIDDLVEIEESKLVKSTDMIDYMGKQHSSLRDKSISDVEYAVKTAVGEFNYLDYEGQHITTTNSIGGHVKSAILKGQTLVNLSVSSGYKTVTFTSTQAYEPDFQKNVEMYKPNTKYLVITEFNHDYKYRFGVNIYHSSTIFNETTYIQDGVGKVYKHILTTKSDFTGCDTALRTVVYNNTEEPNFSQTYRMMIIEYQDGMENWDIPYFEGMASVKMPVLTTTGKNLLDESKLVEEHSTHNYLWTKDYTIKPDSNIKLKPNTTYCLSLSEFHGDGQIFLWNGKTLSRNVPINTGTTARNFRTNEFEDGISFYAKVSNDGTASSSLHKIQLEENSIATSYEPFKSNILTVNEEVELRGIGDVKDELNLLTGELTQRIGEVVLDGSDENWTLNYQDNSELITFVTRDIPNIIGHSFDVSYRYTLNNKFNNIKDYKNNECLLTHNDISALNKWLVVTIKRSKLSSQDVKGFKEYLGNNPVIFNYVLLEPFIKTVVLNDNVVYSYDEVTHYDCSSENESLIPTVSVSVPTDLQAVISQQRNTIQTLTFENEVLKEEVLSANHLRETGDLELLSSDFELDFRLMEIESALDIPTATIFKGVKSTSRSPYEMAKVLISAEKYDYHDMHYKLGRYLECKKITEEQYNELISLID